QRRAALRTIGRRCLVCETAGRTGWLVVYRHCFNYGLACYFAAQPQHDHVAVSLGREPVARYELLVAFTSSHRNAVVDIHRSRCFANTAWRTTLDHFSRAL